ncbi:MAG: hypothetical protein V9E94_20220 [Microthrixaceae bacterium]
MAYGVVLVFDEVSVEDYWAVNAKLGIEADGSGDWPAGMLMHSAGPTGSGWLVSEVWETKADQEVFMAGRLGAALGEVGVAAPVQVIESDLENYRIQP